MRHRNPFLAPILACLAAVGLMACAPFPGLVANNQAGFQTQAPRFITLGGRVTELLPEDTKGSRHQLFRYETAKGLVKVAHNTDLAPYVPVRVGDRVTVRGEYLAQPRVIHWSHHDPKGGPGGYIEHQGRRYE